MRDDLWTAVRRRSLQCLHIKRPRMDAVSRAFLEKPSQGTHVMVLYLSCEPSKPKPRTGRHIEAALNGWLDVEDRRDLEEHVDGTPIQHVTDADGHANTNSRPASADVNSASATPLLFRSN